MSSVWDLHLPAEAVGGHLTAEVRVTEFSPDLFLEVEIPGVAEVMVDLDESSARRLRDWLSWWLCEAGEPES